MTGAADPSIRQAKLQASTARHYERHPFDFLTEEDERRIDALQPPSFARFVEAYGAPGRTAAEIGCGPGRGTMYLESKGLDVVAVDISPRSLELAQVRSPGSHFVLATNLALPLPSDSFDIVVSDGVIHHTPDPRRSFRELARLAKPGGRLYIGVYNRRRYYFYLYTWVGPVVRWLERSRAGRMIVYMTAFPPYYLAHLIKSRGRRTLAGAMNFFYDYIITPQATFHTREEIVGWGDEDGLDLTHYDPGQGNVHVFFFAKRD